MMDGNRWESVEVCGGIGDYKESDFPRRVFRPGLRRSPSEGLNVVNRGGRSRGRSVNVGVKGGDMVRKTGSRRDGDLGSRQEIRGTWKQSGLRG